MPINCECKAAIAGGALLLALGAYGLSVDADLPSRGALRPVALTAAPESPGPRATDERTGLETLLPDDLATRSVLLGGLGAILLVGGACVAVRDRYGDRICRYVAGYLKPIHDGYHR